MRQDVAVVTIVHGRHAHLRGQLWGLAQQTRRPDTHVVVAMADPDVPAVLEQASNGVPTVVVDERSRGGRLALAAARNAGARAALHAGASHVVFLDVDCIPSPTLVQRYTAVLAQETSQASPVVVCGDVRYLDAVTTHMRDHERSWSVLADGSVAHPSRPPITDATNEADVRLFWSLSFATTVQSWTAIGGFDEAYVGYGGEDTDFGQRLAAVGGRMLWADATLAYHQHHDSQSPPVQHVHDIVENANRFARRWGWWPMQGWLDAFDERGLVERMSDGDYRATSSRRL